MLPPPTFTFTIPSIYDDTLLHCRIHTPHILFHETPWTKKGAIFAHPYPPLGGCYDDPVVQAAVAELLTSGFVVGTFNFRGVASSKSKTSWTGRPEVLDFISFAGFFTHYLDGLKAPAHTSNLIPSPLKLGSLGSRSDLDMTCSSRMSLILGGYSYGSLIATRLPATETILNRFANVINGTAEAEIRLRALHLSRQWNKDVQVRNEVQRTRSLRPLNASTSSSHSIAIAIGGDECEPGSQRSSRESRRSVDAIRTSMERSRRIFKLRKHSGELVEGHLPTEESLGTSEIELPRTYYLLISPLLPPISLFATMFSKFSYTEHEIQASSQSSQARSPTKADGKLVSHQTMAIYGDRDFFTPQKKLRKWAEQLAGRSNSCFQFREVAKAGHFWHEEGAEAQMRGCVRDWLQGI